MKISGFGDVFAQNLNDRVCILLGFDRRHERFFKRQCFVLVQNLGQKHPLNHVEAGCKATFCQQSPSFHYPALDDSLNLFVLLPQFLCFGQNFINNCVEVFFSNIRFVFVRNQCKAAQLLWISLERRCRCHNQFRRL